MTVVVNLIAQSATATQQLPWWAYILMIFTVPAIFVGVVFFLGMLSGWRSLAKRFPAGLERGPVSQTLTTARLNLMSYNGVLSAEFSERGLVLRFPGGRHAGHAPICLPWGELVVGRRAWFGLQTLHVRGTRHALRVKREIVDEVKRRQTQRSPAASAADHEG